jgi:hypothetical protein
MVTDCKAKGLRYLRLIESVCYSQRALVFALFLSFLQPAISQGSCSPGTAPPCGLGLRPVWGAVPRRVCHWYGAACQDKQQDLRNLSYPEFLGPEISPSRSQ